MGITHCEYQVNEKVSEKNAEIEKWNYGKSQNLDI